MLSYTVTKKILLHKYWRKNAKRQTVAASWNLSLSLTRSCLRVEASERASLCYLSLRCVAKNKSQIVSIAACAYTRIAQSHAHNAQYRTVCRPHSSQTHFCRYKNSEEEEKIITFFCCDSWHFFIFSRASITHSELIWQSYAKIMKIINNQQQAATCENLCAIRNRTGEKKLCDYSFRLIEARRRVFFSLPFRTSPSALDQFHGIGTLICGRPVIHICFFP